MKPAPTLALSASFAALAASPAFAADGVASTTAITSTGGSIALVGFALVGAGALILARTRHTAPATSSVDTADAEAAATTAAPESADVQRLLKLATDERPDTASEYYVAPAAEETVQYRGSILKTSSARKTVVMSGAATEEPTLENDEVAQQMLQALRAERARRLA